MRAGFDGVGVDGSQPGVVVSYDDDELKVGAEAGFGGGAGDVSSDDANPRRPEGLNPGDAIVDGAAAAAQDVEITPEPEKDFYTFDGKYRRQPLSAQVRAHLLQRGARYMGNLSGVRWTRETSQWAWQGVSGAVARTRLARWTQSQWSETEREKKQSIALHVLTFVAIAFIDAYRQTPDNVIGANTTLAAEAAVGFFGLFLCYDDIRQAIKASGSGRLELDYALNFQPVTRDQSVAVYYPAPKVVPSYFNKMEISTSVERRMIANQNWEVYTSIMRVLSIVGISACAATQFAAAGGWVLSEGTFLGFRMEYSLPVLAGVIASVYAVGAVHGEAQSADVEREYHTLRDPDKSKIDTRSQNIKYASYGSIGCALLFAVITGALGARSAENTSLRSLAALTAWCGVASIVVGATAGHMQNNNERAYGIYDAIYHLRLAAGHDPAKMTHVKLDEGRVGPSLWLTRFPGANGWRYEVYELRDALCVGVGLCAMYFGVVGTVRGRLTPMVAAGAALSLSFFAGALMRASVERQAQQAAQISALYGSTSKKALDNCGSSLTDTSTIGTPNRTVTPAMFAARTYDAMTVANQAAIAGAYREADPVSMVC